MKLLKEKQKIKVRIFMEVMGWPEENLTKHLKNVLNVLKEKQNWRIIKEDYATPEKVGEKMFLTHVEFEAECPGLNELFMFCIMFGPSVVEILNPPELYITAGELQDILSDLISKVQIMDKDIKLLSSENKKIKDILKMLEDKGILKKESP